MTNRRYHNRLAKRPADFSVLALVVVFMLQVMIPALYAQEDTSDSEKPTPLQIRYELVKEAYAAQRDGKFNEAIDGFEKALAIPLTEAQEYTVQPSTRTIRKAQYYAYKSAYRDELAYRTLEGIVKDYPDDLNMTNELAYAYLQRGEKEKAANMFAELCREDPNDTETCRKAGYLYIEVDNTPLAIGMFATLVQYQPGDTQARRQLAYMLLNAGAKEEAQAQFEILSKQMPEDTNIHMQLAYMYLEDEKKEAARDEMAIVLEQEPERHNVRLERAYLMYSLNDEAAVKEFETVADQDEDLESKQKAEDVLGRIKPKEKKDDIWFGDVYAHLFFTARWPNLVLTGRVREGIKTPVVPMKFYLGARLTRDIRSKGVSTSGIFEDNMVMPLLGVEFSPWVPGLSLFYEIGPALYLYDRGPDNVVDLDMRGGLTFFIDWQQNGPVDNPEGSVIWPATFFGELYTDFIWFYRFQNNWIGYFNIKEGLNLFQHGMLLDQIYLHANLSYDVDGVFYNNKVEFGPGMRVMPWDWLNIKFYAEYLMGFYIPRKNFIHDPLAFYNTDFWVGSLTRKDDNPNDDPYHDFRLGVIVFYEW